MKDPEVVELSGAVIQSFYLDVLTFVFRANGAEPTMLSVVFVMLLSLVAARLECMLWRNGFHLEASTYKESDMWWQKQDQVKDDNWNAQFKTAHQHWNQEKMTTESKLSSSKAKQTYSDLTSPANRTVFGDISSKQNCIWRTKNVESKTPDFPIALFIY